MAKHRAAARIKRPLLGPNLRRLQPKLRMIANGSTVVNTIRAELSAAVKITTAKAAQAVPRVRGFGAEPLSKQTFPRETKAKVPARGRLNLLSPDVEVNVFIQTTTPENLPATLAP